MSAAPLFLTLGAGQTVGRGLGSKAALLDRAAAAGLPVPRGLVLLDAAYRHALAGGLIVERDGTLAAPDPQRLIAALGLVVPLHGWMNGQWAAASLKLAVRSAFGAEDRADSSLAGFFVSHLNVPAGNLAAVAAALCSVWASAARRAGEFRRDVLIMQMVAARQAGVAFTEREYEDDWVNFTAGTADTLVSGAVEGDALALPKTRRGETRLGTAGLADFAPRLQTLLRAARRVFGAGDWDIEWADDGQICWLVQIRPITRAPRRNEAFTVANLKEIFPEVPSRLMTSAIAASALKLFIYRDFDASLPAQRPFIEIFRGRPYINLSLLADTMRILGLPTRLVTDNIGGEAGRATGLNLRRMAVKTARLTLLRFALAQILSPWSAARANRAMLARAEQPGDTFATCFDSLVWVYARVVRQAMILATAIGPMLALLRATGTLDAHSAQQSTIGTRIFTDLEPLRALLRDDSQGVADAARGELPANPAFRAVWTHYLKRHGHRGIYESDVARPRFHEEPAPLLTMLALTPAQRPPLPRRGIRHALTWPLWWQASRTMQAREWLRYTSMAAFDRIRQRLRLLAQAAVERGQLRRADDLWLLDGDEVRRLDTGWTPDAAFWAGRAAEIEGLHDYHLPDLIHRLDDFERYRQTGAPDRGGDRLSGISLTAGETRGRAWVLAEPAIHLPDGFIPAETILVARSIDAGWIPTFARVAGVVVETGGDLSHGSIILREIGLPAITNVRGVTRQIVTGDRLVLRAASGVVERVTDAP